jgi:GNAT superfamily N-acetyltransferase
VNPAGARIREAVPEDAPDLAELIADLGYDVTVAQVSERLGSIAGPGSATLVAETDGRVAGCLTTSMMRVLHRPAPVGRISLLVVAEGLRGRGIGTELVRAAELRLRADGCYMIEVTSHVARPDAHRFYEALGYERTSFRFARRFDG